MSNHRLKLAVARHTLSLALNRSIPTALDINTIKPRHLLRALLRQSSYLPDATARDFFHGYILDRFRKYHPRERSNNPTLTPVRRQSLHKEARKGLLLLKRANDGHKPHLLRVLSMAYGRTGRKRRDLLKTVMTSSNIESDPPPMDEIALAQLSESITENHCDSNIDKRPRAGKKRRRLGPRLKALFDSQKLERISNIPNSLSSQPPSFTELNEWGQPMPQKRVANMKDKWYAEVSSKVLPPLPESDWNMLRDSALGRGSREGMMKRRTPVAQRAKDPGCDGTQPVDVNRTCPNLGAGSVMENHKLYKYQNSRLLRSRPHTITPRFMRRIKGEVFQLCPKMKWNDKERQWDVEWGNLQKIKEYVLSQPGRINMDMFKGVDEAGNVISSKPAQ